MISDLANALAESNGLLQGEQQGFFFTGALEKSSVGHFRAVTIKGVFTVVVK